MTREQIEAMTELELQDACSFHPMCDEDDYYAMCDYDEEDDAYYPSSELGAPRDDYSIHDFRRDFLMSIPANEFFAVT